jgi:hypothetical protein
MDNTLTRDEMYEWQKELLKNTHTIEDYMYLMKQGIFHYDIGIKIKMTDKSYLFEYGSGYSDIQHKRIDKKDVRKINDMLYILRDQLVYTLEDKIEKMYSKSPDDIYACWGQDRRDTTIDLKVIE